MRVHGIRLCFLLMLVPVAGAQAETVDEETAIELRMLVDQLIESVLDDDTAVMDEVTCLGDLLHAQLRREETLGLVPDADDPMLVEERESTVRAAVRAFVERALDQGQQVELVDASRIVLFEGAGGDGEMLTGEEDDELEITATGVLGLKMLTLQRQVDIDVSRLLDRWCLNPLSMQ